MALALTELQRERLNNDGFVVLESFITGDELTRVTAAVQVRELCCSARLRPTQTPGLTPCLLAQDVAENGDGGVVSPIALEMMGYEPLLPYLVDAVGWNVHMR